MVKTNTHNKVEISMKSDAKKEVKKSLISNQLDSVNVMYEMEIFSEVLNLVKLIIF